MDVSHLLDDLNTPQREAVTAPPGNLLVLAGAGSGKTRVLVQRIAWLVQVEGASPWNILAVTFTNKAAREMRARLDAILGIPVGPMWVGTFHGLAHRLLRAHWQDAGLPQGFQILDSDDQLRLIKRVLRTLELDDARWPPRQVQWYINGQKDEGHRPDHLDDGGDFFQREMIRIYREYDETCRRAGLVDFAELLLRSHELWLNRPDILVHYRERFRHILVDEFQDTNAIQYAWLRMLAGNHNHLFVVGDDDQSIYGWRGARVENIHSFQSDFTPATLIRLEQNYRSTGNILAAANAVVANNPSRLGKNLWTDSGAGDRLSLYTAFNESDEARFVADKVRSLSDEGLARSQIAVLYRTTAQSRQFEEAFIHAQIPYRVYGGLRFFERAEIKDALAYLRLVSNRHDDASFERVVNQPPRGIGAKTLDAIRAYARDFRCSLWQASADLVRGGNMPTRAATSLRRFIDIVESTAELGPDVALAPLLQHLLSVSGLHDHFATSRDLKAQDRIENLDELINAAGQFVVEQEQEELTQLDAFLATAALEAGDTQADEYEDSVQLMTLHSAKGLEFSVVFVVGLEEGLFPHSMSSEDPARLEEERRLCYVGMTRAMRRLFLSHAECRRLHGSESYPLPSRFLREIPAELVDEVRVRPQVSRPYVATSPASFAAEAGAYRLGQRVSHPRFGEGIVLNAEGSGSAARVQVNFEDAGPKWLVLAYANLSPV